MITILVPNYNKASYLTETLNSVLAQTDENWECIIVDDHSTDNSWEILEDFVKKDKRIKIFKRPESLPKGGNSCRNYALTLAKGDFIQWFDSDDIMAADLLQHRLDYLITTGADFVLSHGQKFHNLPEDLDMVLSPFFTFPNILKGFLAIDPPWLTPSLLLKKDFIIRNNLSWDQNIHCFQDIAYNTSCFLKSKKIAILNNEIDWFWRSVPGSTGNSLYLPKNYKSNVRLLSRLYFEVGNSDKDLVKGMALLIIKNSLQRLGLTQVFSLLNPLLVKGIITGQVYLFLIKGMFKKYKKKQGIEALKPMLERFLDDQIKQYNPVQSSFGKHGIEDFYNRYQELKIDFAVENVIVDNKKYYLL